MPAINGNGELVGGPLATARAGLHDGPGERGREGDGQFFDLEEFVYGTLGGPGHAFGVAGVGSGGTFDVHAEAEAQGAAGVVFDKSVDVFSVVVEDEVALAEGAAGDDLDGVGDAGMVFDDGDDFVFGGAGKVETFEKLFGGAEADDVSGAEMAGEENDALQIGVGRKRGFEESKALF